MNYTPTDRSLRSTVDDDQSPRILHDLFAVYGGTTFDHGLYRVHDSISSREATEAVQCAYPGLPRPITCFGFDWLGRQFALDVSRGPKNDPEVVLLEPGTGEALEVPVAFSAFHDYALMEYRDSCLLPDFFDAWQSENHRAVTFDKCVGYKNPLFLSGIDDTSNLELIDTDVYWSISGQLIVAARNLPNGTKVSGLDLL